jgi:hypothetical protein
MTHTILPNEMEFVLNTSFSTRQKQIFTKLNLQYEKINIEERDRYIISVIDYLLSSAVVSSGEHRISDWENGWKENLDMYKNSGDINSIIPKYHGKHTLVHWRQEMVRPVTPLFDYLIHTFLVDWVFEKYLHSVDTILEFGCGPAYHLLRFKNINNKANFVGLDWAESSQEIIKELNKTNIVGRNFNYFNPDYTLDIKPNSGIITIASLEQIGDKFDLFLNFLLEKKPVICVHLEPIDEVLNQNNLIDRLSMLYFKKRNYLKGFVTKLKHLEDEGKVEIVNIQRTYTGSYFVEGHTLVVWKPKI